MKSVPFIRAFVVLAASAAYVGHTFRVGHGQFSTMGLGDWMDPYFINALLEHWFHAVRTLSDPSSPPMFFPVRHTLGYSHGLVLYAPFYVPLRAVLHPFQAYNATILLAIETGVLALYALLRRWNVEFFPAFALTALFMTSGNVINGMTGVWTQRASVFLIPPILLLVTIGWERRVSVAGRACAFAGGLLAGLLYVQDFYTAHLAVLLVPFALAAGVDGASLRETRLWWSRQPGRGRAALIVAALAALFSVAILVSGGGAVRLLGVRVAARDWRRPAVVALAAFAAAAWLGRGVMSPLRDLLRDRWRLALAAGVLAGIACFLWTYLPAYREHPAFPADEVREQLTARVPYLSVRTFAFAAAAAVLSWIPWFAAPAARRYVAWVAIASAFVLLVPLRLGGFSMWTAIIAPLPGFGAIRDPKRIIYLYELAVALAAGMVVVRAASPRYRATVAALALALAIAAPGREQFDYERDNALFDRWVAAPIAVDPQCRSFYVTRASAEYMSRYRHMGALYGLDAVFVALRSSVPTLNGFSAWYPERWELWNPHEDSYPARVRQWIDANRLTGVCALDIDARRMTPPAAR